MTKQASHDGHTFSGLKVILLSKAASLVVAKQWWLKGILHGNQ